MKFTADDVVTEYRKQPESMTFSTFIRSMAEKKMAAKRYGTAKTYRDALASFSNFRNGEDVSFDALDKETICQYEAWMEDKGLKLNTSSCYLRTLKTLYLKAVDMGLTEDKDISAVCLLFCDYGQTCHNNRSNKENPEAKAQRRLRHRLRP